MKIIIKFSCNARSDWRKLCALSENRARVENGKLAFKFVSGDFPTQIKCSLGLANANGNMLLPAVNMTARRPLLATAVLKLYVNNKS